MDDDSAFLAKIMPPIYAFRRNEKKIPRRNLKRMISYVRTAPLYQKFYSIFFKKLQDPRAEPLVALRRARNTCSSEESKGEVLGRRPQSAKSPITVNLEFLSLDKARRATRALSANKSSAKKSFFCKKCRRADCFCVSKIIPNIFG